MNRLRMITMCLLAMMAASLSVKAQEVTITLMPGWTWISVPITEVQDFATTLGSFTPMTGDIIKSQWGNASYTNGQWRGNISQFYPGYGYMYKSTRTMPVTVTFNVQQPAPQVIVTTTEPTDITATSAVVSSTVTIGEGNHIFARGVCWSTEPNPDIDGNHTSGEAVAGSQSVTLTELIPSTIYYVHAYVVTDYGLAYGDEQTFTTLDGGGSSGSHAYVDLGLPSGLLWATCNVGADNPEDYGDHFAWGETQPKNTYNWSTYQYCNGSENTLTKYCNNSSYGYNGFTDNLTTLLPEDDAATANWGSNWRMPTQAEFQELLDNTTVTWTTLNGVNGRLFTAANGNSLFLPAAGFLWLSDLYDPSSSGLYLSRSLDTYSPRYAWVLSFGSGGYDICDDYRSDGQSVRPVRVGSQNASFNINATINPTEGGAVSGGGTYDEGATCTLTATASAGYTFTNWTENGEVVSIDATYTFIVSADRTLVANFTYNGGDHAYVDLGLPSGLLWATCNVGADSPKDYGDYFAWGETASKDTYYDWSTYQYCNGIFNTLTKYCNNSNNGYNGFTDNLTTLLPEDDAATANWGSNWRMPTQAEFQELLDNTTVTWTIQNGVTGRLFTAANGNSLFLPAAGGRWDDEFYNAGRYGYYWSSSLNTDDPNFARGLCFDSDYAGVYGGYRYNGFSVRPVRIGSQNTSFIIDATANPAEGGEVSGGGNYQEGTECTLTATANEGYTFTNWTENDEVVATDAIYTFTVNADRNLVANFTYNGVGNHGYVDLGLPSGLLWATCNVGADNPEDYGDYFAWGETTTKSTYNWSTYQYCNNGDFYQLTKYCNNSSYGYNGFTDNQTTLLPEDDAATANWGSGWRMPTKEEFQELYNNTTVTWTQQNGVNGRLFTASNGNSLFLPAAGYRWVKKLYDAGYGGYYWSSSLYTGYPSYAKYFFLDSGNYHMDSYYRLYGLSVRPVRSSE